MKKNTWLSWSSGKDSAYSLYQLKKDNSLSVKALVTTITNDYERVSMHSTRKACLELQAKSLSKKCRKPACRCLRGSSRTSYI